MKGFDVVFSLESLDDIEHAAEYYNEQQLGLGRRFVVQVQVTLANIIRNPFFASVRYDSIRCAQVNKFPFLIHYEIDEIRNTIFIVAIYSTYKKPIWEG